MSMSKEERIVNYGILVALAVVLILSGLMFWKIVRIERSVDNRNKESLDISKKEVDKSPEQLVMEQKTEAEPAKTNDEAEKIKLATVGKGEGIESVLIRQLIAEPEVFGFEEDSADDMELEKWAQREAHIIATKAGYFDWKFGGEVRVRQPDKVAFVLTKDAEGNLSVNEFVNDGGDFQDSAQSIQKVASSYSEAKFLAHEDNNGNFVVSAPYGYFQLPV